jgi:hypothetical protein
MTVPIAGPDPHPEPVRTPIPAGACDWTLSAELRERILVRNPERLYGFPRIA